MSQPSVGRGSVLTLLLLSSMTVMAGATISPTLPSIGKVFADTPRSDLLVRLVLTLPALFTAIGAPIAGGIIDRFGRRPLLFGVIVLYALAGGSGLFARDLSELLIGRAGLGLAVGGILTTATTLIADYFGGDERSKVLAWQSAFMGIGGVGFVTLGGFLTDVSWRAPFSVYLLALVYLPLVALFLPEPRRSGTGEQVDDGRESATGPDGSSEALTSSGATASSAMVPRRVLGLVYALGFLGMIVFFALPVQLPFHLQAIDDVPATKVGLALATMTAVAACTSLAYPKLRTRLSFPAIFGVQFLLQGAGYLLLGSAPSYTGAFPGLVIAGAGAGLLVPNVQLWTSRLAPAELRGRVLGGLGLCLFLGQFLSPMVTQPLATSRGYGGMYGSLASFLLAFSALFILGSIVRKNRRPR
ncbi:MAG: MFS transporter [Candidatus Eisenbacteria bacterium]|uniref:MFS transporter n=1 Tax=Eiseniibacteriota bacterium TaxID=2212470 RepID=A0A956SH14_UNCEI|nr:MFS transporter [Candidatus Eisenbacteria bacterium]